MKRFKKIKEHTEKTKRHPYFPRFWTFDMYRDAQGLLSGLSIEVSVYPQLPMTKLQYFSANWARCSNISSNQ